MKDLTTTSYAILAHLAVRPFSAYELAQQFGRGLRLIWPRAESAVYEEPKNLVAHGLATVRKEKAGRRHRSVYSITPKGRRALRDWLGRPSEPPAFESESHVRVMFAEHADKEALLSTLRQYGEFAAAIRRQLLDQIEGYVADGGPFPERLHIIALGARFLLGQAAWMQEWATWAERQVRRWPGTGAQAATRSRAQLEELLRLYRTR